MKYKVLSFDGVDDYVEVPNWTSKASEPFTVEIVFRQREGAAGDYYGILNAGSWLDYQGFSFDDLRPTPQRFSFIDCSTHTKIFTTFNIEYGRWYHVVGRHYDTIWEIWVDGELDNQVDTGSVGIDWTGTMEIGGAPAVGRYSPIDVALVRIYNRALTETEIKQLYYHKPILDGLVLWLMPQREFVGTWWDRSGNRNHGKIYGATSSVEEFHLPSLKKLSGVKAKALSFDGVDDHVKVPNEPFDFSTYSGITVEVLVKAEAHDYYDPIFFWYTVGFGRSTSTALRAYLHILPDEVDYRPYIYGFSVGEWHYVAFTFDYASGDFRGFMDGVLRTEDLAIYPGRYCPDAWGYSGLAMLGATYGRFKGLIALARIYNRALTAEEIQYNYQHPYNPILHGCVLWLAHDTIDEVAGKWYDKSGYGNDGTIYGTTNNEINRLAGRVLSV
jgi:hypothetical protein